MMKFTNLFGGLLIAISLLSAAPVTAYAATQQEGVTGVVQDEAGEPIIGAGVQIKGTTTGVATDIDGSFRITASRGDVLLITFVGMKSVEVPVTGKPLTVILEPEYTVLGEVVAIGYGTQKRADVTSAVATVKSESFTKGSVIDAGQLIQGKVAGLNISLSTGDPGASTSIMLRGTSSLKGGTSPLILVDGVPGSFSTVAPEDIESVDVLKDGSATAIYGTRGTNGVIIITTRQGSKVERLSIDYNGYLSVADFYKRADFMDAEDLRARWAEGYTFSGANDQDYGATTDWLGEISRVSLSHAHNLTFNAGNKNTTLVAALNYSDREGTMRETDSKYMRARTQVTQSMFGGKLNADLSTIVTMWNSGPGFNTYVYRQALIHNPTQPVFDENGDYFERSVYFYDNPVGYLNESLGERSSNSIRFTGRLDFRPIEDLSIKGMFTIRNTDSESASYTTHKHVSTVESGRNGSAYIYNGKFTSKMAEITIDWKKTFGMNRVAFMAGYNFEENVSSSHSMSNSDFPTDAYTWNSIGAGLRLKEGEASMSSYKESDRLVGLFARATYNFDDRYLAMVSLRHEGSSKFGADRHWGNFPGVSLGWRINQEDFFEDLDFVERVQFTNLKLRAGFGITGINVGDPYLSQSSLSYSTSSYFLYNDRWINILTPSRNANPDLHWEIKEEYNIGLDWELFAGRLGGSIDYYTRLTKDALWDYSVPSPPYQYGSITANVGQIKNAGLEILLTLVPVRGKGYEWSTSMTYSSNTNQLVSISNDQFSMTTDYFDTGYADEPIQTTTHRVKVGEPIGNFFGLKSTGVNEKGKWMVEYIGNPSKGEAVDEQGYAIDAEGNRLSKMASMASSKDWQVLGNGVPKHYVNWNNTFRYKGLDVVLNMRGAFGYQILNSQRMFYGNPTIQYNVLNCAFEKVGGVAVISDPQRYVSYYIEDGDYWKIDNFTIGYSFKTQNFSRNIRQLRLYASGLNLYTFTNYQGLDPEVSVGGLNPGTDARDKYPTSRTITVGLNLTF